LASARLGALAVDAGDRPPLLAHDRGRRCDQFLFTFTSFGVVLLLGAAPLALEVEITGRPGLLNLKLPPRSLSCSSSQYHGFLSSADGSRLAVQRRMRRRDRRPHQVHRAPRCSGQLAVMLSCSGLPLLALVERSFRFGARPHRYHASRRARRLVPPTEASGTRSCS
jgi:hypothetical protein